MKLWQKDTPPGGGDRGKEVETFTVGKDREMDMYLAAFDVLGSLAHIEMLESVGLLTKDELNQLQAELKNIYSQIQKGTFQLQDDVEDIHSQVELLLTEKLGDIGKKIHSARSRNDQVLLDLKFTAVAGRLVVVKVGVAHGHEPQQPLVVLGLLNCLGRRDRGRRR